MGRDRVLTVRIDEQKYGALEDAALAAGLSLNRFAASSIALGVLDVCKGGNAVRVRDTYHRTEEWALVPGGTRAKSFAYAAAQRNGGEPVAPLLVHGTGA